MGDDMQIIDDLRAAWTDVGIGYANAERDAFQLLSVAEKLQAQLEEVRRERDELRARARDLSQERDEARKEARDACIALADSFVPQASRAGAHLQGLPRLVAHAAAHHTWHHDASDTQYVARIEAERDELRAELQEYRTEEAEGGD